MTVRLSGLESHLADGEGNFEMADVDFHLGFVPSLWAGHQRAKVVPILVVLPTVPLPVAT